MITFTVLPACLPIWARISKGTGTYASILPLTHRRRRLIEKVTAYEDKFIVEFKSGVAVNVTE
jgi:hypothetical protein